MKRLSVLALVLIGFLGALLTYVYEDIPAFGDPKAPSIKYTWLFSMDADALDNQLNQGVLPVTLINELKERGFPEPSRVEGVPGREKAWNGFIPKEELHYLEDEKYYFVQKEGDKLVVFRYAFVVRWIERGLEETGVPNMVTYGLADYRGYDTLGEVTVIFTAGVSVILLLRRRGRL
jgi:multicomponent Na+:H+ antiporter subunit B